MADLLLINRGENFLTSNTFYYTPDEEDVEESATPVEIPFEEFTYVKCELMQEGKVVQTYEFTPPSTFTPGLTHVSGGQFQVQISTTISKSLSPGYLEAKWTALALNPDFSLDNNTQTEIVIFEVALIRE